MATRGAVVRVLSYSLREILSLLEKEGAGSGAWCASPERYTVGEIETVVK
jgi:hypothetical protein